MFGQRKRLRHMAARMLLVWLFALGTGIVHACIALPQGLPAQGDAPLAAAHHCDEGPDGAAPEAQPGMGTACAKFCDQKAHGLPSLQPQDDAGATVWMAPPPSVVLDVAMADDTPANNRHDRWRPPRQVPIPIAYLRLTL